MQLYDALQQSGCPKSNEKDDESIDQVRYPYSNHHTESGWYCPIPPQINKPFKT